MNCAPRGIRGKFSGKSHRMVCELSERLLQKDGLQTVSRLQMRLRRCKRVWASIRRWF